jgi:hypothetical protein
MTITATPEPFLSAEIAYRQQRVRDLYAKHPRRHRVRRRRGLTLPHPRRRPVAVA